MVTKTAIDTLTAVVANGNLNIIATAGPLGLLIGRALDQYAGRSAYAGNPDADLARAIADAVQDANRRPGRSHSIDIERTALAKKV